MTDMEPAPENLLKLYDVNVDFFLVILHLSYITATSNVLLAPVVTMVCLLVK